MDIHKLLLVGDLRMLEYLHLLIPRGSALSTPPFLVQSLPANWQISPIFSLLCTPFGSPPDKTNGN
jgi:hypothetical protein